MIPFMTIMLVGLLGFYYVTIFLQLMGFCIFDKKLDVKFGLGLIPFYYWFKRIDEEIPVIEEEIKEMKEVFMNDLDEKNNPIRIPKQPSKPKTGDKGSKKDAPKRRYTKRTPQKKEDKVPTKKKSNK